MAEERLIARVGADISGFRTGMDSAVSVAKKAATRIAFAFASTVTSAALMGANFEQAMREVGTVAQASAKDLENLTQTARKLGATTQYTATEAAKGMYDLASAGMTANQVMSAIEYSMKLAGATGAQMNQATQLVSASLHQFNLEANQTKRITDTYSAAITKSLATMDKLTEGMKFAGVTGAAFNWSVEQTTAALVAFIDLGLQGGMAGRHLNAAMNHLVAGTNEVKESLGMLGLRLTDINPSFHTFGEILETLGQTAFSDYHAIKIFGAEAGMQMLSLIKKAQEGKYNYDQFVNTLKESQKGVGRTSEMYAEMMDTFKNAWKNMLGALEELALTVFDRFKIQGKNVFQFLEDRINALSKWIQKNKKPFEEFFTAIEKSVKDIANRMGEWVEHNKKLIDQDLPNMIGKIGDKIKDLVKLYNSLPDNIIGAAGTGLIVRMLTGSTRLGAYAAAVTLVVEAVERLQKSLSTSGSGILLSSPEQAYRKVIEKSIESLERQRESLSKELELPMLPARAAQVNASIEQIDQKLSKLRETIKGAKEEADGYAVVLAAPMKALTGEDLIDLGGIEKPAAEVSRIWEDTIEQVKIYTEEQFKEVQDQIKRHIDLQWELADKVKQLDYELAEDRFGLLRYQLDRELEEYRKAEADHDLLAEYGAKKRKQIAKEEFDFTVNKYRSLAGNVASTFQNLAQAGGKHGQEMFKIYKAAAIAEAALSLPSAIMKALNTQGPWKWAEIAAVIAAGTAQIAAIKSAQPPSYDEGGISRHPGYYYSGVPEAHIPLKGGKIPIEIGGGNAGTTVIMNNPVFQDMETQRAVMAQIAEIVVRDRAPMVIRENYNNDGMIRSMVRGGI